MVDLRDNGMDTGVSNDPITGIEFSDMITENSNPPVPEELTMEESETGLGKKTENKVRPGHF